ncbi:flagellar biosynthetic protein FliR [Allopusillimonas soli]|uniref:Flagellar biosynthetic protein FliR n=1 Tax=Allopusillimonas soli TaxID=659016 RepID=A0A853FBS1_9BURK|nr:flagellar biosynthetic protein FliR [Allopusillimonas soli]NYT35516.1 flagellar biosynthetic protein FliR [Allopusillimonas soli]TEA75923.1 flagellar biosynthetic protein FliR [Allopusillimonas soli]
MIDVNIGQLHDWMNAFLLPFIRVLALVGSAPLLGESSIPAKVKVGLSALTAIAIAPTLQTMPDIVTGSYTFLWLAMQQVLIGIALGLVMRIVFAAVQTAGEFIGLQMGLSFASFFDPATGANTAVLSRLMNTMAMLLFIALNGHLVMLGALIRSFDVLPPTPGALDINGWGVLMEWSGQVLVSGMLLALPLIIVLLTINLALGILNRTAQQLSVFAVGFPITLLAGLVLLAVVMPQTSPFLSRLFDAGYEAMARLAGALAGL